jgi:nitrogen regulatory protein P-II 1
VVLKKITAIVRTKILETLERRLQNIGVTGITVTQCGGYGKYESLVKFTWSWPRARVEIYCDSSKTEIIAETIMEAAHTGTMGDGIIAIEPVDALYRIRTKAEALESEI